MEAGGESQGDEPEFVDPFDTGRDGESDSGEVGARDGAGATEARGDARAVEPPAIRTEELGSDLSEEIPPEPGEEGDLAVAPLAVRLQAKLNAMSPEQQARHASATREIMSHPAVAAFSEEEERRRVAKADVQQAFLAAYRKKAKEKA